MDEKEISRGFLSPARCNLDRLGIGLHDQERSSHGGLATPGPNVLQIAQDNHLITLYRAVKPEELTDIQGTGQFINRGSAEGKYFALTGVGASAYAKQTVRGFGDPPYTLVITQIPEHTITSTMRAQVDRGIAAVVIPDALLP